MPKNNKEKVETFSQTDLNELFNPVPLQAQSPSHSILNSPEQTPTSVTATIKATFQFPIQEQGRVLPLQPRVPLPAQLTVEFPIPASLA